MVFTLDKRVFYTLNNYLCEEKKFLFGLLKVTSCNATLSVPFNESECKYDGYWDETCGIPEMLAVSFKAMFNEGVSLLQKIEDSGEDGLTDYTDDDTKAALIRLNEYFRNKENNVKSLITVLNMQDATETDIAVAFGEHLLGLLAPGKSYSINTQSKGKRSCRCGCNATPVFKNTGIGHEEVWHGHIDLVFSLYPSSHEGMPSIAKIVVQQKSDEEKHPKKRKLKYDESAIDELENCDKSESSEEVERKKLSPGKRSMVEVQALPEKEYEQAIAQTIVFSLLQEKEHPKLKSHVIPNIVISPEEIEVLLYDAENDILFSGNRFKLFVEKNSKRVTLFDYSIVFLWMVLNYKHFFSPLVAESLKTYKSNFPTFAAGKLKIYKNDLRSNVGHFDVVNNLPDVQFFLQTSIKLVK